MAYHISSRRRLCSDTSSGSVAKRPSSAAIRERVSSILFPMAAVSCGWVGQIKVLNKGSQANLGIRINGGNGL